MKDFIGANYQELGLSPKELQTRMGKWFSWNEKMQKQGVVKGGEALVPHVKRVSGPEQTVTDAPLIQGKELMGFFYIVQAENADAVVKIAEDYPDYDLNGSVEIREVLVFDQQYIWNIE